jgi:xanthine dehydrogenase accessory factor
MLEVLKQALERINKGETIALITIVKTKGSTPAAVGAKMLINKDGLVAGTIGRGIIEAKVIEKAKEAIKSGKSQSLSYHLTKEESARDEGAICGGDMKVFIDILQPREEILIFGAGHIAIYLSKLAKIVGFRVTVIDERKEFANQERFPEVDQIITKKVSEALNNIKITSSYYIVIVTKGHLQDEEVLNLVIQSNAAYIGMIGSHKKMQLFFNT